jgi:hypothetical protein
MTPPAASVAAARVYLPTGWDVASLGRVGYGLALICCPGRLIRLRTGEQPGRRTRAIGRVLGVRHVAQAMISAACPSGLVVGAGVTADIAHAGSMVVLAGLDADLRPALLTDAAIAGALAGAGALRCATAMAARAA